MTEQKYIEPFAMRDLFTASGQPGLWTIKSVSRPMGIAVMSRLTNPKQTIKARISDLSPVESIRIATTHVDRIPPAEGFTDPGITTVASMFDKMYEVGFDTKFDALTPDEQRAKMLDIVPDMDPTKFLPSHFSKITKWYADLVLAMSMIEPATDPYDNLTQEDYDNA